MKKLLLAVSISLMSVPIAAFALPTQSQMTFSVNFAGIPLGEVVQTLNVKDSVYTATAETRPNTSAKLLFDDQISENCRFSWDGKNYSTLEYITKRTGKKGYSRHVTFKDNQMSYIDGRTETSDKPTFDQGCFGYALPYIASKYKSGSSIFINDGEKNRPYLFTQSEDIVVDLAGQSFNVQQYRITREDKDNQYFDILVDKKTGLPVKITRVRKGRHTHVELIKMSL